MESNNNLKVIERILNIYGNICYKEILDLDIRKDLLDLEQACRDFNNLNLRLKFHLNGSNKLLLREVHTFFNSYKVKKETKK